MSDTTPRCHPVRVDGPADDRRLGRRVEEVTATRSSSRSRRRTCSPRSTRRAGARRRRHRGGARGARVARRRPALLRAARRQGERRRDHRQPVPPDPVSRSCCRPCSTRSRPPESATSASCCANGKVFPMSDSDIEQKIGKDNLARMERLRHRRSARTTRATPTTTSSSASPRGGTPVWLHKEVAALRRQDHDRPGAVEPLGRRRRRQADPPRRRLRRDDRVEPLRLRAVAADALRRVRRARCARTSTRSRRCAASTAR